MDTFDFFLSKYGAEAINSLCSEAMAHFQGRSDGIFCALSRYRPGETLGLRRWHRYHGSAARDLSQDGVQYITLMVGWGGAAALANIPGGGPIKRGYSSVLTFSVGANTKLEVPPFRQTGPPTVAAHMRASPATIHEDKMRS